MEVSSSDLGVVMALKYAVRRAKRRVHTALLIDIINEVDRLDNIISRVSVGTFSMWASRECPAEETAFASAARKARWWCLARSRTGTVMKAKSNWRGS